MEFGDIGGSNGAMHNCGQNAIPVGGPARPGTGIGAV